MDLNSLCDYRKNEYFTERKDHYFLVSTITPLLRVAKLFTYKGLYWFDLNGFHIKATTTLSVSLNDLKGTKVHYTGYPIIKGRVVGWGLNKTPFIYVFWGRVPMKDDDGKQLGFPCALPNNFYLKLEP